jgi:sterol desaturase/sphingolipid hydroxylase (fatty acid hydroxylase superfamily)
VSWRFGVVRYLLATPQYHHWHHSADRVDVNFAVHFPFLDRLFGTYFYPKDRWPTGYGLPGDPVPKGYLAQFKYPFRRGTAP